MVAFQAIGFLYARDDWCKIPRCQTLRTDHRALHGGNGNVQERMLVRPRYVEVMAVIFSIEGRPIGGARREKL